MPSTMIAGRLDVTNLEFGMQNVPIPEPGPGEVRIKVEAAGICLSDIHLIDGTIKFQPRTGVKQITLGHEVSGRVDKVGLHVARWHEGDKVLLNAVQRCARCVSCLEGTPCVQFLGRGIDFDGGWAEYTLARQDALLSVPEELPFEVAAILPDAVSTPYAAIVETAALKPSESIGLWGVGGLGAHAVQIARAVGAVPIIAIDPLPEARKRALSLGADVALDPLDNNFKSEMLRWTDGKGLDVAIDIAGVSPVRPQALSCLANRGRFVVVGIAGEPLTISNDMKFCFQKLEVKGHIASTQKHLEEVLKLTKYHRLDFSKSVTEIIPLAEAPRGVEMLIKKENNPIRLVLRG